MQKELLDRICKDIYKQFPEVNGKKPKVRSQGSSHQLLIFHGAAETADGHRIPRTVRVVVDNNGSVTKITTSR
jgi:hypothetical protein